jgi:hypothetical protein
LLVSLGNDPDRAQANGAHSSPAIDAAGVGTNAVGNTVDRAHPLTLAAIRTLGVVCYALATAAVVIGLGCVEQLFHRGNSAGFVTRLESFARVITPGQADDTFVRVLIVVAIPVVPAVGIAWFFGRLGHGLRSHSSSARWLAVAILVPVCIPPLVRFFQAMAGGAYVAMAVALLIVFLPASFVLLLSTSGSDILFGPEYRSDVSARPCSSVYDLALKVAAISLGMIGTVAFLLLGY